MTSDETEAPEEQSTEPEEVDLSGLDAITGADPTIEAADNSGEDGMASEEPTEEPIHRPTNSELYDIKARQRAVSKVAKLFADDGN